MPHEFLTPWVVFRLELPQKIAVHRFPRLQTSNRIVGLVGLWLVELLDRGIRFEVLSYGSVPLRVKSF